MRLVVAFADLEGITVCISKCITVNVMYYRQYSPKSGFVILDFDRSRSNRKALGRPIDMTIANTSPLCDLRWRRRAQGKEAGSGIGVAKRRPCQSFISENANLGKRKRKSFAKRILR